MSGPRLGPAWRTLALVFGAATAVATISVLPPVKARTRTVREATGPAPGATPPAGTTEASGAGKGDTIAGPAVKPPRAGLACAAGRNGGATDVGVTATSIKLGATVVDSGIGASFLRDARFGMLAVKNAVNRSGGICGRKLELVLKDDEWRFDRGGSFLQNLVEQDKVFALAVVPSSEGLKNISDAGYLRRKGVPVVGSDGMLIHQYTDPWIWPVAASTMSTMHIMAKQAYDAGARRFGIVYEHSYHFGVEGAYAFNQAVKRLTGHDVEGYSNPLASPRCNRRFCGIAAPQASYGSEIQTFNNACFATPRCDFVALLLEPATALTWMKGGAITPGDGFRMGGPQPLFSRSFAEECDTRCNNLTLWTGFDPPIGGNLGRPAIAEFVNLVRGVSSSADVNSTFVQGAYVGMRLLVAALERVGPDLTRGRLGAVLDSMRLDTGLSAALQWRRGDHFANTRMQAWSIQYKDRFSGWRDLRLSIEDPWVGLDIPK
jgi:ABC-type branched-subunit amino acid transport system substrate-binding protein